MKTISKLRFEQMYYVCNTVFLTFTRYWSISLPSVDTILTRVFAAINNKRLNSVTPGTDSIRWHLCSVQTAPYSGSDKSDLQKHCSHLIYCTFTFGGVLHPSQTVFCRHLSQSSALANRPAKAKPEPFATPTDCRLRIFRIAGFEC